MIEVFNIETEFGTAGISDKGYYRITSVKEGNCGKYLHRLIYEKYKGDIPKGYVVHHINGNRIDNSIENLELLTRTDHSKLHMENFTDEHRNKISEARKGMKFSEEHKRHIGDSKRGSKSPFWKDYARVTKGGVKNGKKVYSLKYNGKVVTTTPYKEQLQEIADKINNAEDRDAEFKEQFKIIRREVYYITKMGFKRGKQVFALKYSGNLIQRSVDKNKLVKLADSLNLINKWSMIY